VQVGSNRTARCTTGKKGSMQEKEEEHKENEEQSEPREHLFNEWKCIQQNIRQLIRAMENDTDEIFKHDLQSDINVLLSRKKFCKYVKL